MFVDWSTFYLMCVEAATPCKPEQDILKQIDGWMFPADL